MRLNKNQICNLANFHLGNTRPIINVETETSVEAKALENNYELALEKILGDARWPFARTNQLLELIKEDPVAGWAFSYKYPANCVDFIRIPNGTKFDDEHSLIEFELMVDGGIMVIYTNQPEARGEYTLFIDNTLLFKPDFTLAFSYLLAFMIAPAVTNGDPMGMAEKMYAKYKATVGSAMANAMNEGSRLKNPLTPSMKARL